MRRLYLSLIKRHFASANQMLFLVGPRQVGKTTIAKLLAEDYNESLYLNWDALKDRKTILSGQDTVAELLQPNKLRSSKPLIIFDEIHKFNDWKNYIKGFYDLYKDKYHILVTGSARLDIYQSGGDSLMGRYFLCRVHPLSLREIEDVDDRKVQIMKPINIKNDRFNALYEFGGFPDPFIQASPRFSLKWHSLRSKQLFYEDIKDLSNVHDVKQIEVLAELIKHQTGQLLNRSNLSKKIQVSVPTISRWMLALERFFYCFAIKPWSSNVSRSLIKEVKIYLWDWAVIENKGAKFENFVACHLLKAIHLWNDEGMGEYGLYYLRNKDGQEVDFIVTRDNQPWFLVEAKLSDNGGISKNLRLFQGQVGAKHAFQVIYNMSYVEADCFDYSEPMIIPASTFLSQLV